MRLKVMQFRTILAACVVRGFFHDPQPGGSGSHVSTGQYTRILRINRGVHVLLKLKESADSRRDLNTHGKIINRHKFRREHSVLEPCSLTFVSWYAIVPRRLTQDSKAFPITPHLSSKTADKC